MHIKMFKNVGSAILVALLSQLVTNLGVARQSTA